METNAIIQNSRRRDITCMLVATLSQMLTSVANLAEPLRRYYSTVLNRQMNLRQTWLLINAQVSFFFAAFPCGGSFVIRLLCTIWMLHALFLCKKNI